MELGRHINLCNLAQIAARSRCQSAATRLMSEIAAGEESAEHDGWIDESDVLEEFGVAAHP